MKVQKGLLQLQEVSTEITKTNVYNTTRLLDYYISNTYYDKINRNNRQGEEYCDIKKGATNSKFLQLRSLLMIHNLDTIENVIKRK
ncbi:unnamed protein product (macronuclear) [Paramecium tetraurelia]|uniref:Uncharacterized protein n=1 Tax=Paramecium tetraurelia TaxID=5888 RepID=A0E4X6_PARTE|nr:uncharacterized protein GSPATT00023519001 [Paramecium tetraurelia]CAK90343.1 unnamed protein product [Paramecium tetraurelia]|eukprot:XP_001457740.1 hypothetical protein (macronuclear) [Paramecium tetraurelia strain d4-2]